IRSGKLNAGMPATTPTGSAKVIPIRPSAPGIASSGSTSPTVRVAASAQNRSVPTARCTSSRVSRTVLPVSESSRSASSDPRASTLVASSARIAARRERGRAAVSGRAPLAAASAASTSAGPACATMAAVLPSQGNRTGAAEMPGAGAPATSRGTVAATAAAETVLSDIAANLRPCSADAVRAGSLQPETDLQRHLVVRDLAVDDVAADVGDLEPVEVPKGGVGAADAVLDGVLETG